MAFFKILNYSARFFSCDTSEGGCFLWIQKLRIKVENSKVKDSKVKNSKVKDSKVKFSEIKSSIYKTGKATLD